MSLSMEHGGRRRQSICYDFPVTNSNGVANVLNFVVLIAAISVYNSCIYCNSRMLHGLAEQGNAPAILKK